MAKPPESKPDRINIKMTELNLKQMIQKVLDAHTTPLACEEIAACIKMQFGKCYGVACISARLREMVDENQYCVKWEWCPSENGSKYKRWFCPTANKDTQLDMFKLN